MASNGEIFTTSEERRWRIRRPVVSFRLNELRGTVLHVRIVVLVGSPLRALVLRLLATKIFLSDDAVGVSLVMALGARVSKTKLDASVVSEGPGVPVDVTDDGVSAAYCDLHDSACLWRHLDLVWCLHLESGPFLESSHDAFLLGWLFATLAPFVAANAINIATEGHEATVLHTNTHRLDATSSDHWAHDAWLRDAWDQLTLQFESGRSLVLAHHIEYILENQGVALAGCCEELVGSTLHVDEAATFGLTSQFDGYGSDNVLVAISDLAPDEELSTSV
mmetsp:Transcript_12007/g.18140  ORF Transcript_12007/g.18140 Transcript_12007/m.18140 type:complete len:278 (-) Transcript_12007:106-939(-)